MARRIRKLESGAFLVGLEVGEDVLQFAMRQAVAGGYFGPADYLNAVLNTAMLHEREGEPLSAKEIRARRQSASASADGLPF